MNVRAVVMSAAVAGLVLAGGARAGVVFSDSFNSENGGQSSLSYTGFSNFSVAYGSVDLIKSGDYGIGCAGGSGACVAFPSAQRFAGSIQSLSSYAFAAGDQVTLSFDLSGDHLGASQERIDAALFFGSTISIANFTLGGAFGNANQGSFVTNGFSFGGPFGFTPAFQTYTLGFQALAPSTIQFRLGGGSSNPQSIGLILDNVSLSITSPGVVPEPATWALMIGGFGMAGAMLRRRKLSAI